jgi:N-acetylmuramoyl-L-alanine amidase
LEVPHVNRPGLVRSGCLNWKWRVRGQVYLFFPIRWSRWASVPAAVLLLAGGLPTVSGAAASSRTRNIARVSRTTPWEAAERGREELEAMPEGSRTSADYNRTMDRFRALYHSTPRDMHAAASVYAVAELLAEQGRTLHDPKSLKAALGEYEFLRKQYPGSSLRVPALLAEGQIDENDLNDHAGAKERYQLLLKQYPHSEYAEEARAGITGQGSGNRDQGFAGKDEGSTVSDQAFAAGLARAASSPASLPPVAPTAAPLSAGSAAEVSSVQQEDASIPSPLDGSPLPADARQGGGADVPRRHGKLAQVTGIRHWSTTTYTRVAIDLGDDVTFEAARVPNPDRIYFDLHGTRLAQDLVGKSFTVTDNGFLKKIRAAQFSNDMTRVVLDVNDVSEYSAFLLPNPYRLIIDIHGGKGQASGNRDQGSVGASAGSAVATGAAPVNPADVPAPRAASAGKETASHPVPNTVTTRSSSTTEIASLSQQPDRVQATSKPTSQPISAVVSGAPQPTGANNQGSGNRNQGTSFVALANPDPANASPPGVTQTANMPSTAPVPTGAKKRKSKTGTTDSDAVPARAALPTADGETSLVRALGLKIGRIVIDPGHGGHDSGTIGVDGLEEKDVVLDVALRLGKLLHERLGAEIIYTRSDDTFIPLETRTAIANKAQADLFLSIHANSSSDATARGVETYYLNFTSTPDALETAARENAVSTQSIHELSDLVKKIALKDKIDESREFASDVQQGLYSGLTRGNAGLKNRGVKKAPFVVLIGANMPSVLAEISFVTNPRDANELRQPEYRERVAESLYKGVARYEAGLNGLKSPTLRASTAGAN